MLPLDLLKSVNLGIRFVLELCTLLILGYWGFQTGEQTLTKLLLGIGSPFLLAIVWGTFLAPRSATRLHGPWSFLLEIALFGLAALALYSTGRVTITFAFGMLYLLNKILMLLWRQ